MRFIGMTIAALVAIGGMTAMTAPSFAQTVDNVVGTVIRFSNDRHQVDVTIGEDNPTVRDLLSRLPLTMQLAEYAGKEKIGYFDPKLETGGSPGSDPDDGDLIYFTPWGNFGFYYDASGIGYSDQTIHLGTYEATAEELHKLEGKVTIEVVRRPTVSGSSNGPFSKSVHRQRGVG